MLSKSVMDSSAFETIVLIIKLSLCAFPRGFAMDGAAPWFVCRLRDGNNVAAKSVQTRFARCLFLGR